MSHHLIRKYSNDVNSNPKNVWTIPKEIMIEVFTNLVRPYDYMEYVQPHQMTTEFRRYIEQYIIYNYMASNSYLFSDYLLPDLSNIKARDLPSLNPKSITDLMIDNCAKDPDNLKYIPEERRTLDMCNKAIDFSVNNFLFVPKKFYTKEMIVKCKEFIYGKDVTYYINLLPVELLDTEYMDNWYDKLGELFIERYRENETLFSILSDKIKREIKRCDREKIVVKCCDTGIVRISGGRLGFSF